MKATDPTEFLNSLNAGVFAQQLGRALSDVAGGVVDFSFNRLMDLMATTHRANAA